eukprot:3413641-Alexandrium_andersonii.AAC.1
MLFWWRPSGRGVTEGLAVEGVSGRLKVSKVARGWRFKGSQVGLWMGGGSHGWNKGARGPNG